MATALDRRQFLFGAEARTDAAPGLPRIRTGCLAMLGVHCRTCGDVCPEVAIVFPPRLGLPPEPSVRAERCTRCGECASVCPTGAIRMSVRHA
jgi:ferredoxin-type protein NapF